MFVMTDDITDDDRFPEIREYDPIDAEFSHILVRARMADLYTDAMLDEVDDPQAATARHIKTLWDHQERGWGSPHPEWRSWVRLDQRAAVEAKKARYGQ